MRPKARVGLALAASVVAVLSWNFWKAIQTMDQGTWEPLRQAPGYHVRNDYEGRTSLGYQNHWWQEPQTIVGGFYDFRRVRQQVVGYDAELKLHVSVDAAARSSEESEESLTYSQASVSAENEEATRHF
ncbi:hypothetical protein [Hymenobacter tenuis]